MTLNPNQERAVGVALRLLEERLARIEEVAGSDESGVLYRRVRPGWTDAERARFDAIAAELRATIASISETFHLAREDQDSAAEIAGLMRVTWENLAGIQARHLRAYGRVDPSLRDTLDPSIERLLALVSALEGIALGDRASPGETA
jgi:hypothetical protein